MRYCHKCGQQLSENATYCPKCGTLVSKNNVETRNHSSDKSHEQSLILPIAAAFLVIIAVGLTFFIGHKKTHVSDADPNNMNENEQVTVGTTSEEDNSESTEGKTEQITEQTKEEPFSFPDITSMKWSAGESLRSCSRHIPQLLLIRAGAKHISILPAHMRIFIWRSRCR